MEKSEFRKARCKPEVAKSTCHSDNAATDTEYGPLKTATVMRWDWNDGNSTSTKLLHAYVSIGGFLIGKDDSQYNQFTGYAGDVANDDVIYDGPYELNQVSYKYDAGNGLTAVASLEDTNSGANTWSYNSTAAANDGWQTSEQNHYAPDGILGLGYKAGNWAIKVVGGYDSIVEEGAIKARVDASFGAFTAFLMGGWNTDGNLLNQYAGSNLGTSACTINGVTNAAKCGWGEWAVWSGVGVPLNEELKWNLQLAYSDSKIFAATTNLKWIPVRDLVIQPEVSYTNFDYVNKDSWEGLLRFQRSF